MFNVVAVPAEAKEVAQETRLALEQLINKATYPEEVNPVPAKVNPVPAEDNSQLYKALRKLGKELYMSKVDKILDTFPSREQLQLDFYERAWWWLDLDILLEHKVEWVAAAAMLEAGHYRWYNDITSPYFLEGIFQGMRQYLFQQGKKAPFILKYYKGCEVGVFEAGIAPHTTSLGTDRVMFYLAKENRPWYTGLQRADWGSYLYSTTENDVAFLHGFKSYKDASALRWTSARAASVVKDITGSDGLAKQAADELRNIFNYTYDLYPNDCDFGQVYDKFEGLVDSCMAGDSYSLYIDGQRVHPCAAYSSAYNGSGDNGLVLIVAKSGSEIIGRGIMNTNNNMIVRWYGGWKTYVQLSNILQVTENSAAFENSWLALLLHEEPDVSTFTHPYVDGRYNNGYIDWELKRVELVEDGCYSLSNTDTYQDISDEDLDNA